MQCRTSGVHIDEGVSLLSLIRNLTVSTKTRITTTLIICFSMCHYYSPSRTIYLILAGVGYCVMFIRLRFCQNLLSDKQRTTPHFLFDKISHFGVEWIIRCMSFKICSFCNTANVRFASHCISCGRKLSEGYDNISYQSMERHHIARLHFSGPICILVVVFITLLLTIAIVYIKNL